VLTKGQKENTENIILMCHSAFSALYIYTSINPGSSENDYSLASCLAILSDISQFVTCIFFPVADFS